MKVEGEKLIRKLRFQIMKKATPEMGTTTATVSEIAIFIPFKNWNLKLKNWNHWQS